MRLFRILAVATAISLALPTIAVPVAAAEKAKPYVVVAGRRPHHRPTPTAHGAWQPPSPRRARRSTAGARPSSATGRFCAATTTARWKLPAWPCKEAPRLRVRTQRVCGVADPSQVDRIQVQKGVIRVLEDQMRYPQTDSTPRYLRLDADGGPYDRGVDGEDVVVGVIDTGSGRSTRRSPTMAVTAPHRSARSRASSGTPPTTRTTSHSPATTSCSAPARCWRPIVPFSARSPRSSTPHATTAATGRTRRRRPPGNAKVLASIFGKPVARMQASPHGRGSWPTRASASSGWVHLGPRSSHRPGSRRRRRCHLLDRRRGEPPGGRRDRLPVRGRCRRLRGDLGRQRGT